MGEDPKNEDVFLIDDSKLDRADGRYAVFDDNGDLTAQDDDLNAAMAKARAKGVRIPALIDLELTRDQTYVF